jgi:hypothetical protein
VQVFDIRHELIARLQDLLNLRNPLVLASSGFVLEFRA